MIIDNTLLELSYTDDTLTLFVQLNQLERRAVKFTHEEFKHWLAEQMQTEGAWCAARASNPYRVLGISRTATDDDIQQAYRTQAKHCHPDTSASDTTAAMQAVNNAYAVLSDPQQRQAYDRTL